MPIALAQRQHAEVVPGRGQVAVHLQRHRQMLLRGGQVAVGHQFGAAVVVVVGQRAAVGDRLRAAPVHQHAAVQVDAGMASVETHADVDVAGVV
ncbi:hypothetical protein [Xanthomonas graminis]|uniref:hypothetical protein n=1 Tax=Xanthomonas graminis TaxID=3390026 RepID=UPI002540B194|nr:hypothetical protein [Xanthomonas translucens]